MDLTQDAAEWEVDEIKQIHHALSCPICHGILQIPITISICQHTFCSECIHNACDATTFKESPQCPVCRIPITKDHFFHCQTLQHAAQAFTDARARLQHLSELYTHQFMPRSPLAPQQQTSPHDPSRPSPTKIRRPKGTSPDQITAVSDLSFKSPSPTAQTERDGASTTTSGGRTPSKSHIYQNRYGTCPICSQMVRRTLLLRHSNHCIEQQALGSEPSKLGVIGYEGVQAFLKPTRGAKKKKSNSSPKVSGEPVATPGKKRHTRGTVSTKAVKARKPSKPSGSMKVTQSMLLACKRRRSHTTPRRSPSTVMPIPVDINEDSTTSNVHSSEVEEVEIFPATKKMPPPTHEPAKPPKASPGISKHSPKTKSVVNVNPMGPLKPIRKNINPPRLRLPDTASMTLKQIKSRLTKHGFRASSLTMNRKRLHSLYSEYIDIYNAHIVDEDNKKDHRFQARMADEALRRRSERKNSRSVPLGNLSRSVVIGCEKESKKAYIILAKMAIERRKRKNAEKMERAKQQRFDVQEQQVCDIVSLQQPGGQTRTITGVSGDQTVELVHVGPTPSPRYVVPPSPPQLSDQVILSAPATSMNPRGVAVSHIVSEPSNSNFTDVNDDLLGI
eukprot:gnl/Dysnectes_brevis/3856_a4978_569.p1 GENE.gnl/Dysnectes_brevis/3856_a4978_569~~gnl/Dysnectes_brevis/3856_a4978_569.p1  ORF type:complete len:617 (+),score=91.97 gnl/Dysnectes_brevis/3856_a4978_569:19-1869(+)